MKEKVSKINSPPDYSIDDIYTEYNSPLRGFIRKRVASKEDSEDILQNVFYQLSKVNLLENPIEHISAWLYQVARNQIIDKSRKHKEVELASNNDGEIEDKFVEDITTYLLSSDTPEKEFVKTLIWDELELSLSELPDEQRNVFELHELEGFSFKEIAEATSISVNTLISQKRYAVLHLRKRLAELYEDLLSY